MPNDTKTHGPITAKRSHKAGCVAVNVQLKCSVGGQWRDREIAAGRMIMMGRL